MSLTARVQNGRLVLDEPTDLPEGEEVTLVVADDWSDMSSEERAELDRALEESIVQAEAGQLIDAEVVMAELRSRRESTVYAKGKSVPAKPLSRRSCTRIDTRAARSVFGNQYTVRANLRSGVLSARLPRGTGGPELSNSGRNGRNGCSGRYVSGLCEQRELVTRSGEKRIYRRWSHCDEHAHRAVVRTASVIALFVEDARADARCKLPL